MSNGDAGCDSYAEERGHMPELTEEVPMNWVVWIVRTDTRMTGACR